MRAPINFGSKINDQDLGFNCAWSIRGWEILSSIPQFLPWLNVGIATEIVKARKTNLFFCPVFVKGVCVEFETNVRHPRGKLAVNSVPRLDFKLRLLNT